MNFEPFYFCLEIDLIFEIGYWVDGQRHGHGIMFYSDQTNYMGRWVNDKRSGYGDGSALIFTFFSRTVNLPLEQRKV